MGKTLPKTIITGAGGMLGKYVDFGIPKKHADFDVTNLPNVLEVVKKDKPQIILHMAAETDVDLCERDPQHAYMINTVGTYNMILAAQAVNAKLLYISTAGVFDGKKKSPYHEADKPNPQSHYSRSKFLGEVMIQQLLKNYLIIRAGWLFGGGPEIDHKFVGKILRILQTKDELQIVKDTKGTPTYGKDFIEAVKKLIPSSRKGILHLSNYGVATRYDMAKIIAHETKPHAKIHPVLSSAFSLDVKRVSSEAMKSKYIKLRPWQDALVEYIQREWSTPQSRRD